MITNEADDVVAHRKEPHSVVCAGRGPAIGHRTALHAEEDVGKPFGEGEFRTRGDQRSVSGAANGRPRRRGGE